MKRHKHDWNLIDKHVIPPALKNIQGMEASGVGMYTMMDALSEHVVYAFKCDCGDVKVVKE